MRAQSLPILTQLVIITWAEFKWDFVAKIKDNGEILKTEPRETQIYNKTERGVFRNDKRRGDWAIFQLDENGKFLEFQ